MSDPRLDRGQAFRPHFPNEVRDLAPELARIAAFVIAIGPAEDRREAHETTIAGCEGAACVMTKV
jgi:hypothetical protein